VVLQVYEPADKLYLVGLNPLLDPSKRTYVATGDSGQGMTGAAVAAMVLTDAILDRPSPYRDVSSAPCHSAQILGLMLPAGCCNTNDTATRTAFMLCRPC
jgi:hypothetical protein